MRAIQLRTAGRENRIMRPARLQEGGRRRQSCRPPQAPEVVCIDIVETGHCVVFYVRVVKVETKRRKRKRKNDNRYVPLTNAMQARKVEKCAYMYRISARDRPGEVERV